MRMCGGGALRVYHLRDSTVLDALGGSVEWQ
jgi:hypothetical protein